MILLVNRTLSYLMPADDRLLGVPQQGGNNMHQVLREVHGTLLQRGVLAGATEQLQHQLPQASQVLPLQCSHVILPGRLPCQNFTHTQASCITSIT